MNNKLGAILGILFFALVVSGILSYATPQGRMFWNNYDFSVQKIDDATNYKTIKMVEDTCRSMIASYESDKLIYEQYISSEDKDEQSWAKQAKMRANKTASTYNNYILENSFVWNGNVPSDIKKDLKYLE